MYQRRAIHPLSKALPPLEHTTVDTLWDVFVAIGEQWALEDEPATYRLRFETFLENRINVSPIYRDYYIDGADFVADLITELGRGPAYNRLFTQKPRVAQSGIPATRLEAVQRYVANEFISLRLALGGFKAFGAINYRGYIGGANIEGEPTPYREL
ncbi:hypothetical protein [Rhizobium ruizarguesonis]|uniref:hypothetical protein n=1 Tax=Rhizobium ruizarguesonis TaxID=2081791 RepID=UPI001030C380|nr:hypothetical protein [Rhizobium ruizarguesonis]TBA52709.1 hypothetical protein ELH57_34315 [Rhizobium ruizarguesonis]